MFSKKASETTQNPLLAWQPTQFKTAAARRFMAFCQEDFPKHNKADGFDPSVYADAVKLVISRLEASRQGEESRS